MHARTLSLTIASILCFTIPAAGRPQQEPGPPGRRPPSTPEEAGAPPAPATGVNWNLLGPPPVGESAGPRLGTYAIHDAPGDRLVLFGGWNTQYLDDTWALALGGASPAWTRLATSGPRPAPRVWHGIVFDSARRRMLVIGGSDQAGGYLIDVWALDLAAATPEWTQLAPAGTPPAARECRGALYDPVRDRVLLFGGFGYPLHYNDTWALNLSGATPTWQQLFPTGSAPIPRRAMSLTYDPVGDRLLVFGGYDNVQFMHDLWSLRLSGAGSPAWSRITTLTATPPGRFGHTATYDPVRREVVVHGGYNGQYLEDMYVLSLSGTPGWTAVTPSPRPSRRDFHTVAYDPARTRMVLIGGNDGTQPSLGDLWALNTSSRVWSPLGVGANPPWPRKRLGTFAVHDEPGDRMVFFGGYDGTWLSDTWSLALGGTAPAWTPLATTGPRPSARVWHGQVFDPVRRRLLVIGGSDAAAQYLNDVWQLDLASPSAQWTPVIPQGRPPVPRECRGATYDPVRDRVLVFGGYSYPNHLNDIWALELSGVPTWRELSPAGRAPSPRRAMSLTYDPVEDRLLVFGGYDDNMFMNDLWALKLSRNEVWTQLHPVGPEPAGRYGHTANYDPVRHQLVVLGGYNGQYLGDWYALPLDHPLRWSTLESSGDVPGVRDFHSVIFDPARDQFVLYGGNDGLAIGDLWTLAFGGASSRAPGTGAGGAARNGLRASVTGVAHQFALEGFVPNPARSGFRVAFSLPDFSPARVELFDLAGRLVRSRSIEAPQPGRHEIQFDRADALPAGVYVLRLTQGARIMQARGAIVR